MSVINGRDAAIERRTRLTVCKTAPPRIAVHNKIVPKKASHSTIW